MGTELRNFTRFLVPENVYGALSPSFSKVGRIKDVSIGGLAIEYLTDGDSAPGNSHVNVFIREEEFFLSKVPCKIVYDVSIEPAADPQTPRMTHKRCGVQFNQFTDGLRKRLEGFLKDRTNGAI